jgi:uncharacterized protein YjbI with pentapeptide repeats
MMTAKLRLWWEKIRNPLGIIGIIAVCISIVVLVFVIVRLYGTGFVGKTLWDWLGLLAALAIPVVVGFGAAWFTVQQGKVSARENTDNQRETALQAYIDKMSELLLEKKLRVSAEDDEVRKIARARTLTILPRLDAKRKRSVLQFLHESGLIFTKDNPIVDLSGADLSNANLVKADLSGAYLPRVDLSNANLHEALVVNAYLVEADLSRASLYAADLRFARLDEANLSGTDLRATLNHADLRGADRNGADLRGATLVEANLSGASLSKADLKNATGITIEELEKQAKSLKGATMPDGSTHA